MDAVCFILTVGSLVDLIALLLLPRDVTVCLCWFLSLLNTCAVTLPKEDAVEDQGMKKCYQKNNQAVKNHCQKSKQGVAEESSEDV
jgi:hypothetical protein